MEADWGREKLTRWWDPSRQLLKSIRGYQSSRRLRGFWILRHRFWSVVTGADIPLNTRIGGGLLMPHPTGIVIHSDVRIGTNCLIMQRVTLGTRSARCPGVPIVGDGVDIGAAAQILGPVTVGDGAIIGAASLVTKDVSPHTTVGGIPAKKLRNGQFTRHSEDTPSE
jgi:serine O-acetyltransferase